MTIPRGIRLATIPLSLLVLAGTVALGRPAAADSVQVQMTGKGGTYAFSPASITVPVGSTVTWVNMSDTIHTATTDNNPNNPASFDTAIVNAGGQASVTLTKPGTYTYYCVIHPYMKASIVVTQNAATDTPTATGSPSNSPPPPPTLTPTTVPTPAPTSTPAPTNTPTATPTPVLKLSLSLSPKTVRPGQNLQIKAKTLPRASLTLKVSYPGAKTSTKRGKANGSGSYSTRLLIAKGARPGTLTVKGTASLGGQRATKTVKGRIP